MSTYRNDNRKFRSVYCERCDKEFRYKIGERPKNCSACGFDFALAFKVQTGHYCKGNVACSDRINCDVCYRNKKIPRDEARERELKRLRMNPENHDMTQQGFTKIF